jgi:Na+/H+ antiporter NhaC
MAGGTADATATPAGDPRGLPMAAVPIAVVAMLLAGRHLVEALLGGVLAAVGLALMLGLVAPAQILHVEAGSVTASSILIDGLERGIGVSIFTLLMVGLVAGIDARRRLGDLAARRTAALKPAGAELRIVGWLTAAILLTTHSVVAILAVGPYVAQVGGRSGLGPYRRANLLDLTACTWPFVLPFFLPTILAAGTTAPAGAMPRLSPADAGLYNAYSWALVAMVGWAIGVGYGRGEGPRDRYDAGAK